ncbi:GDSL-type esterase/lipase family protein [Butyrivibrio sp. JL13D10]|uniref:GDSL-type esterase/lipase family protein n=1 Tax=Butyrivibrio sp. JL13D10 TaxID=3236815 RepID=UPI0038B542A1
MKWVSTFKYQKIGYGENIAVAENITQRVSFYNNVDASKLRIRFTNRYSNNVLKIAKATITKVGAAVSENVTVRNLNEILLQPGEEAFSDVIDFEISAGDRLVVSIYYRERQNMDSICCFWADGGAEVSYYDGDMTGLTESDQSVSKGTLPEITSDILRDDANIGMMKIFSGFDAVQVLAEDDVKVIAGFGDSITHMSFYTNALQKRLYEAYPGRLSFINCGIGGNRLLNDATFVKAAGKELVLFGKAGIKRFEEDVFELDEVSSIFVLIGINDIMHPLLLEEKTETVSGDDLIEGYQRIIDIARKRETKIYFGTITPCGNNEYPDWWLPEFEATRNVANDWIRSCDLIDGYFDFDKELRDDSRPGYMLDDCNIGDGLHPNTLGGKRMAELVNLQECI